MGDIMKYDKIINVAIGKSRKELNYVNLKLPYSEFIDKYIKNTKYTNETYKEYINFPKDIQDNIKEITEEEIEQLIKELREFVNWPDYTILDNITLLNEKDVMVIIKDRYQLLKINITKEDLDKDNLDGVIDALEKIKMNQNLLKNNINIDELESECEFGKILKSK